MNSSNKKPSSTTKNKALHRAWQTYEKICNAELPPYYHFSVGFRTAWDARTALKRDEHKIVQEEFTTNKQNTPCKHVLTVYNNSAVCTKCCSVFGVVSIKVLSFRGK
jgi:hypothetical protein